jgi:hypothetical protein
MFPFAFAISPIKRLRRGLPLGSLLLVGEVGLLAGRHVARLDRPQRQRLVALARKSKGRLSDLSDSERDELASLLANLEPRLFVGSTLRKLSPVPIPKRLLYGPRGSRARKAAAERS